MELQGRPAEHPLPPLNQGGLTWRAMTAADLDAVTHIAAIGFPDHFEGRNCFENRLALNPSGCFVLAKANDEPRGYLIAYPWRAEAAPALNTLIETLPEDAAVMYLHDLSLHPDVRGAGLTGTIVELLADQARATGWPALTLVAVNDATPFWQKRGFTVVDSPAMRTRLAGYGPDARYMVRDLGA